MTNPCHWMLTANGHDYTLSGPGVLLGNAPDIKDIAHHLAQINRFTGACSRPYSVAEHSLLVERIGAARGATPIMRLALLMHDAHEAYTSDLSSPAKAVVGGGWRAFEGVHALNIHHHFGLKTAYAAHRAEVHACDLIALATERRDLMAFDPEVNHPWPVLDTPGAEVRPWESESIDPDDAPLPWHGMRAALIHRYLTLREQVEAQRQQPDVAASLRAALSKDITKDWRAAP
jgi:hypothetical protein